MCLLPSQRRCLRRRVANGPLMPTKGRRWSRYVLGKASQKRTTQSCRASAKQSKDCTQPFYDLAAQCSIRHEGRVVTLLRWKRLCCTNRLMDGTLLSLDGSTSRPRLRVSSAGFSPLATCPMTSLASLRASSMVILPCRLMDTLRALPRHQQSVSTSATRRVPRQSKL